MSAESEFIRAIRGEFPEDRLTYQKRIPTFHPESAVEVAALFRLANRMGGKLFITGFGNNIDPVGEPFTGLVSVRSDRLNSLIEVSPQNFFVVAGAGFPLREMNHRLAAHRLYLPHSALPYVGSVGGALAAGLNAEMHGHDVPLKKFFIKAEIVTPEGEIVSPGSVCFKSASGYDIVRVYWGSWGLLGMIVSATFRVMPVTGAEDYATLRMRGLDRAPLLASLDEANAGDNAVYSRKIRSRFDPNGVLPIV